MKEVEYIEDGGEVLTTEQWEAYRREERRTRTAANRKFAHDKLQACGIAFTIHNDGHHFVVRHEGRVIDYWAGTGKFRERDRTAAQGESLSRLGNTKSPREGRGIFGLLRALGWEEKR